MRSRKACYLAVVSILIFSCSSDDGTSRDGSITPLDGGMTDGADLRIDGTDLRIDGTDPLPGCSTTCGDNQVCLNDTCTIVGPIRACGSQEYPAGLPANDGIYHVNGAYTGGDSDGSQGKPYTSIADALAAIPGGKKYTVAVAEGTYSEELTIGVRPGPNGAQEEFGADLYCRCAERVTINGSITLKHLSQPLNVTIDGCTVVPEGFDPETTTDWPACQPETYGIKALGGSLDFHLRIRDSVIGGWCTGIYYSAEPDPVLESSLCLVNSRIVSNVRGVEVKNAPATQLLSPFDECKDLLENVALALTRIDHNQDYGIYTYDQARGIALTANVIERTGELGTNQTGEGYGIYLGDTDSASLISNVIRDNHNRGVGMRNDKAKVSLGIKIVDNQLSNNRVAGIALQKMQALTEISITGNRVLATKTRQGELGGDGVQMSLDGASGYNVNIEDNVIDGSDRHGIFYDGVGGSVTNNTISNNAKYGCLLQMSAAVVGTNTFSGNGSGDVNSVNDPIEECGSLPVPLP